MNERIQAVLEAVQELNNNTTQIKTYIPNQASAANQLADKAFVNSSISTANADYRGTFDDLETLQAAFGNKNDYVYYRHTDSAGNVVYDRYKYVGVPDSQLPDEYQEVESINGVVGSAYIDTGVKIEPNMHIKLKLKSGSFGIYNTFALCGAQSGTEQKYGLLHGAVAKKIVLYKGDGYTTIPEISSTEFIEIEIMPSGAVFCNGVFLFNVSERNIDDFSELSIFINAMNNFTTSTDAVVKWNLYEAYSSDETPKTVYVPCYRKTDYVAGMYDFATETFKPSDGEPFNYTELSTDKWKLDTEYHDHSKQDIPQVVTSGTILTLANNTEYYLNIADGDTCTYTLPSGRYECYMRLKIAENAEMSITFTPATGETLKYIGNAPEFAAGEEWEISIKDGVIVAGKVVTAE